MSLLYSMVRFLNDDYSWVPPDGRLGLPVWRLNGILSIIDKRMRSLDLNGRFVPISWSTKHMYSTSQLAKIIALKRGIDPELAGLTCAFHDIYTIHTGLTKDHGIRGEKYIREIITEYNKKWQSKLPIITEDEVEHIIKAIRDHSDKITVTNDPLAELVKDVDSLDSYLHGMTTDKRRNLRINRLLKELDITHSI